MELTQEEIDAWVARHLATEPERDDAWYEGVIALYMANQTDQGEGVAA